MGLVAVTPLAHEASDGRIVIEAPAAATQVNVRIAGIAARARLLARQSREGRARLVVQVADAARAGTDLELVISSSSRELGRVTVADVHLLGERAFAAPASLLATPLASSRALAITRVAGGQVGISAECLKTGRIAVANADHQAVAASTLKVAILATALARDRGSPTRPGVYPTYREAIVASNNDAANRILATVGAGSEVVGAKRVDALMTRLGMRRSFLDGPYRLTAAPSLKRTSASDLERLAGAVYLAAGGRGPLASLGVSRHEARVLIGLMASEDYPGLIRDNVRGPVAHKAGWLEAVQNDLALAFGTPGGTCLVGITTEGLSFSAASAVGRQIAEQVLPLLAVPRPTATALPSFSGSTTVPKPTPPSGSAAPAAPSTPAGTTGSPPWGWLAAGLGIALIVGLLVARHRAVLRRRKRRRLRAEAMRDPRRVR